MGYYWQKIGNNSDNVESIGKKTRKILKLAKKKGKNYRKMNERQLVSVFFPFVMSVMT